MDGPSMDRSFNIFPVDFPSTDHAGMAFPEVRKVLSFAIGECMTHDIEQTIILVSFSQLDQFKNGNSMVPLRWVCSGESSHYISEEYRGLSNATGSSLDTCFGYGYDGLAWKLLWFSGMYFNL